MSGLYVCTSLGSAPPWYLPSVRICDSPTPINKLINNNYKGRKITWWIQKTTLGLYNCVIPHKHTRCNMQKSTYLLWYDAWIPLCCWHIHNTISVWAIVRPEHSAWRFGFTILPYYSTVLILSKNFRTLSRSNVNKMGSHWVIFLLYLNCCS